MPYERPRKFFHALGLVGAPHLKICLEACNFRNHDRYNIYKYMYAHTHTLTYIHTYMYISIKTILVSEKLITDNSI